MPEVAVYKVIDVAKLLDFFRLKAKDKAEGTAEYYQKAVNNLQAYLDTLDETAMFPSLDAIAGWITNLYLCKLSGKSILLYFNSISALYSHAVKEGVAEKTDIFGRIKPILTKSLKTESVNREDLVRLKKLLSSAQYLSGESRIAADLLLLSLLMGGKPIVEVAMLKKSDIIDDDPEVAAIVARNVDTRRKYIFNLRQHVLTPRQLERLVNGVTEDLLSRHGIRLFGSVNDTIASYWAYTALLTGISGRVIVGYLGYAPKGLPLLSLYDSEPCDDIMPDIKSVGAAFVKNPTRWYAMHLRPYVTYDELVERIGTAKNIVAPKLFYPLERIAKRIGKKLVFEDQPIISNIVFFNCRVTDIVPLFSNISDLAWCYTVSGKSGSQYAVISDSSFYRFQEAIGQFTTGCEPAAGFSTVISAGTEVRVSGGLFVGMEASLEKVETLDGKSILQLMHRSDNNIKWSVGIDSRLVKPLYNRAQ